jgi:thioesterase domain-containing protein
MSYVAQTPLHPSLTEEMQRLWHARIPLASALDVRIVELDERNLVVAAPLAANANHMGTGFAGSLLAVASLTGWGTVIAVLGRADVAQVVVQETSASFLEPVTGDFRVRNLPDTDRASAFSTRLATRRAGVAIIVEVVQGTTRRCVRAASSRCAHELSSAESSSDFPLQRRSDRSACSAFGVRSPWVARRDSSRASAPPSPMRSTGALPDSA